MTTEPESIKAYLETTIVILLTACVTNDPIKVYCPRFLCGRPVAAPPRSLRTPTDKRTNQITRAAGINVSVVASAVRAPSRSGSRAALVLAKPFPVSRRFATPIVSYRGERESRPDARSPK